MFAFKREGFMTNLFDWMNKKVWLSYIAITLLAVCDAFFSEWLVYPNDFAPSGIQGLVAMLQHVFGFQAGYLFILFNAPILIWSFFVLNHHYAFKNLCYIASFSVFSLIIQECIERMGLEYLAFRAEGTEQSLIIAIVSGIFYGVVFVILIALGGCNGGTNVLGAIVHHYKPEFNMVWVAFSFKVLIASMSYYVYGKQLFPVIVTIVSGFVNSWVSDYLLKGSQAALKFEIITSSPDELAADLMQKLKHGCTRLPAHGTYGNRDYSVLICVVNPRQRVDFERLIAAYPDTFAFCSPVKCTYGRFKHIK